MAQILSIGFDNILLVDRIISLISPDSAPIKRLIQQLKTEGKVVNASAGRRVKSVIFTDDGVAYLSGLGLGTLQQRLAKKE